MQAVQDEVETIHLYVVREQAKKPYAHLPLIGAMLCLLGIAALTLYSAQHPYYEHQRLLVPALTLATRSFAASVAIIPTGVTTYPATTAHGALTITNGSIIGQLIPAGFIVQGVVTDRAVYVPPGSANGYGYATVLAHALVSGAPGNIPAYSINQVEGSSVYIRNLSDFTGGRDSYAVKYVTQQDKQSGLLRARGLLLIQISAYKSGPHYPCEEAYLYEQAHISINWRCQFVTYRLPAYMRVIAVRLSGKNFLVDVAFIPHPVRFWVK